MIKLATIGTSWITKQFIEAVLKTGKYTVTKVYSRNLRKAQDFAQEVACGQGVDNFNDLYGPDVDMVYIASPNALHFEQAMQMLEHGKHVIVEKPQVETVKQWEQLHQLAKEKNLYVFDAVRHIHTDNYRYLYELVTREIQNTDYPFLGGHFSLGQYSSKYDLYIKSMETGETGPNIFNPEFSGGSLMDLGVYPLYIALGLFGPPHSFTYHYVPGSNDIDVMGTLVLDYEQFMMSIFISKGVYSRQKNEIYIQDKTIEISHISELTQIQLLDRQDQVLDAFNKETDNPMIDEANFFADTFNGVISEDIYLECEQLSYQVIHILEALRG